MILVRDKLNNPLVFIITISIPIICGLIKVIYFKEGKDIDIKLALLLMIWFVGTAYGFTKGVRFGILMVPAFAIAFGVGVGIIYEVLNKWISKELHINKYVSKLIIIVLLCLLLIAPLRSASNTAKMEIPSMNDVWYESLTMIKEDSNDGIITSWWDFGHWFVTISERRVTFDGADQGERIHWVGKSLLTSNEKEAIGILRMLNCGQEQAPHVLESYLENDTVKAIDILNVIILQDKNKAKSTLRKEGLSDNAIEDVLNVTHCEDLIDQYYITSEDMIGKSGVWGHFGSWDFKRAKMYQTVKNIDMVKGIAKLKEDFGLNEEEADKIYYEIQNNKADQWVSSWPGYLSGISSCSKKNNMLKCNNGIEIDLNNMKAFASTQQGKINLRSLAYINDNGLFEMIEYGENTAPYSAVLLPNQQAILLDSKLAGSMFTRLFFFSGHGLKHFSMLSDKKQLTGGKVQVWKVSWNEGKPINIIKKEEEKMVEEIRASHILIKTESRSDEEAMKTIKDISEKINSDNFGDLAKEYSECPSSENGGDLGWFGKGVMVKEFEDAAFALEKDEISQPIKTQFGYHLIKLVDKR